MITEGMPGLLLITGTGRDSGKTTFACKVIRRFKDIVPLIALKISPHQHRLLPGGTVIADEAGLCITEEINPMKIIA